MDWRESSPERLLPFKGYPTKRYGGDATDTGQGPGDPKRQRSLGHMRLRSHGRHGDKKMAGVSLSYVPSKREQQVLQTRQCVLVAEFFGHSWELSQDEEYMDNCDCCNSSSWEIA